MHPHQDALSAGLGTPTNDNAQRQLGEVGEQNSTDDRDCAYGGGNRKALATMKAQAALCGCTLHELSSGGYLLCRWGTSREVPCLRSVGDLLRRMGGRK